MNTPFLPDPWDSQTALSELEYSEFLLSEFSELATQEEENLDISDIEAFWKLTEEEDDVSDIEALWELTEHEGLTKRQLLDFEVALDREPLSESLQSSPPLQSISSPKPPQFHVISVIWQPIPHRKTPEFDLAIDLLEHRKSLALVSKPSQTIISSKPSPLQVFWILTSALGTDIWNLLNVPISLPIERLKPRFFSSTNKKIEISPPQSTSIESLQTNLIRQGDVLIVPLTDKISHWLNHPIDLAFWKDANFQKRSNLVLAEGEVTGHKHRISNGKAELYERDGVLYLRVLSPTALLTHEEHHAVTIPQGSWAIRLQREYEPDTQNWRSVAD